LQEQFGCEYNVITGIFVMRTELVRIGNSRGVRIPKPFIEQCKLGKAVELRIENDCIVISPERRPRHGWDEAFRAAGSSTNDELLLEKAEPNRFDRKEWKW
jgi:antitoxin MazE